MARGSLRIYLGAAPGVGKTYAMLNEGARRHDRGTDVVIGYVETHGRRHTFDQIGHLEIVPRRHVEYRGQNFEEMDLHAVLMRAPDVVLVDELAHTNVPGVEHEKRWQDVEDLLDAGINVITTLNLQHLESVNDVVETITGVVQRETVPDEVVRRAEQIELVDMTPEALRRRLAHGNVYPSDRIDAALSHFFRPGNLAALRELALLWLADRVDDELIEYRERHGIEWAWETKERVAVLVTGGESSERLIRRASRIAARSKAELIGVTVRVEDGASQDLEDSAARCVALLRELGGRYIEVVGNDVAKALVEVARSENATQLVIGSSRQSWFSALTRGSIVQRCVRESKGEIDVHVIGAEATQGREPIRSRRRRRTAPLSTRRIVGALVLGAVSFPLVTWLLVIGRSPSSLPLALSTYLLIVIAVAALGGLLPGLIAAVAAFSLSNFEFTEPIHQFEIANPRDVLALVAFLVAAASVSSLVDIAARRGADAVRAQRDARALSRMASIATSGEGALDQMMSDIVRMFDLDGASLRSVITNGNRSGSEARSDSMEVSSAGTIGENSTEMVIDRNHFLVISGPPIDPESTKLLRVVMAQLVTALDRRRLEVESRERAELRDANALRTSLVAAVSHDLRLPLASIKTAVEMLFEAFESGTDRRREDLLRRIDADSTRLSRLVEDLLDMSRVHEGSVRLAVRLSNLVDVVDQAIDDVSRATGVARDQITRTGVDTATVSTDPALVERVVYNLILNAITHSGSTSISVDVGSVSREMTIRIVDHGHGVTPELRLAINRGSTVPTSVGEGGGAGLGLAISQVFIGVLGGELTVDDTPGGGCTMTLILPTLATSAVAAAPDIA